MDILRLTLFSGLILHKVIWEILKKRGKSLDGSRTLPKKWHILLIKLGKIAVLVFIAFQTLFLEILPISSKPGTLRTIGFTIFVVGLATAITGRLQLGKNWVDLEESQILPEHTLVTRGIYRYVRHPIYTGDLLLVAGLQLALNSWLILAVFPLILIVMKLAMSEEATLARELPGYCDYRRYTKRFIPFVL